MREYRVLDVSRDGGEGWMVTAMTEAGDVKQGLRVLEQGGLGGRLARAWDGGRGGGVRVLVVRDGGRELAVDMKVVYGARL